MSNDDMEFCYDNLKFVIEFMDKLGIIVEKYSVNVDPNSMNFDIQASFKRIPESMKDVFQRKMKIAILKNMLIELGSNNE